MSASPLVRPATIRQGLVLAFAAILGSASMAPAQSGLSALSLEQLMEIDAGRVYGASERLQPVTEAPASVSFITAEDIARHGYRTLADILRGVRGFHVTDDRNFSFIGARGFGIPGDYNSRILLLVNGRRVNDNVFGQAAIGAELGLDPATFERVEIIRGPASSLYGDSAFFAVVNVITRSGESIDGASVALDAGTLGTTLARASAGHRFASGVDVALSATLERSRGVDRLYYPDFDAPDTNHGIAEGLDGEGAQQAYGRLSFRGLTVTGAYGHRRREVPTAPFGTMFNPAEPETETIDRHGLVDVEYERAFSTTRVTAQASLNHFSYDGSYPFDGDDETALVLEDSVLGVRWSAGGGVTQALPGRQTLRAGVEIIENSHQRQRSQYVEPALTLLDIDRSSSQQAVYLQDEVRVARWLLLNAGLRYDRYDTFQRVTPRTAVIVMPSSIQSIKYLYGKAFRAPNAYESNDVYFGPGVRFLRPEAIDTHEVVWERYTNDWLRTAVSGYWYAAKRLITLVPDEEAFLGVTFVNQGDVRARGLEVESQMRIRPGWQALASYSVQRAVDQAASTRLPNSPRHMVKARMSAPAFTTGSSVAVEGQYMSGRGTLSGSSVAPAAVVHLHVVQPVSPSLDIVGGVRNVFGAAYADPGGSHHRQDAIPQNGRTARIGLRWNLWTR